MAKQRDIIIIGSGVAGSSLATALATLGWDVLLLERDHFPRHKVCGGFLSPEALVSLNNMGLLQPVAAQSPAIINQSRLVSAKGITVATDLPGQGWGISRFALDATLAKAAQSAGVELQTGCTVRSIEPQGHGFNVTLQSQQSQQSQQSNSACVKLQSRAVISAAGRHTLPNLPPHNPSSSHQTFLGLNCHYQDIDMPSQVELFFFPGGYIGVAPIEHNLTNVCLLARPSSFAKAGKKILDMIDQAAGWNPALGQRLSGGRPLAETATAVAPVDVRRSASPWSEIACVGDSAVMLPPLCGEGLASALRSAELCAAPAHDYLQGKHSLAAWEAAYRAAWFTAFNRPLKLARFLQFSLNTPLLSDLIMGLGWLLPSLANRVIKATYLNPAKNRA